MRTSVTPSAGPDRPRCQRLARISTSTSFQLNGSLSPGSGSSPALGSSSSLADQPAVGHTPAVGGGPHHGGPSTCLPGADSGGSSQSNNAGGGFEGATTDHGGVHGGEVDHDNHSPSVVADAGRLSAAGFGLKAAAAAGLYSGYSAGTEHNPYPSIPGAGVATSDNSFYGSLVSQQLQ